jgi:hypothetical protein
MTNEQKNKAKGPPAERNVMAVLLLLNKAANGFQPMDNRLISSFDVHACIVKNMIC